MQQWYRLFSFVLGDEEYGLAAKFDRT